MSKQLLFGLRPLLATVLISAFLTGCATIDDTIRTTIEDVVSGTLEKKDEEAEEEVKTLSEYIKDKNHAKAKQLLDELYAAYPDSHEAEASLRGRVHEAFTDLLLRNDQQLQDFIAQYPNDISIQYFEALYYLRRGTKARGADWISNTPKAKLDQMRVEMDKSVPGFMRLLENDPNSYLAHVNLGVNYSYIGSRAKSDIEFRKALVQKPTSFAAWSNFLWYNNPRWGGSYKGVRLLLEEMSYAARKNPALNRLKGVLLADKASVALDRKQYDDAEVLVLQAMEYGTYSRYNQIVDSLHRTIQASGDREGACRLSRKVLMVEPNNEHHRNLIDAC